jgi:hypothetical protein
MAKRRRQSPDARYLIETILEAGRSLSPPLSAAELARRAQITPTSLSRMKKDGRGDVAVIAEMARIVGLRLSLVPDDTLLVRLQSGSFFDD